MKEIKIAIMGQSGVGKDYIVDVMTKGYSFNRVSFSDQLKKLAVKIYPWMKRDYPASEKELPLNITVNGELITKTPREIWLSLNRLRDIEDGMFVRMLEDELKLLSVPNIVISDIRTQNELDWCKANDFQIVAVMSEISHPENKFDDFVRGAIARGEYDFEFDNTKRGNSDIIKFVESCFVEINYKEFE